VKITSGHRKWFVEIRKPDHWFAFDSQEPEAGVVAAPLNRPAAMFALEVGSENAIQMPTEFVSNQIETHQPARDIM
jgi:hypothetical protein